MDQFDVLDHGGAQFARVLGAVTPQDWASPTPCEGWTVRDLVVHVVGGTVMSVALLGGATSEEAFALLQTDVLGDEPLDTFLAAQAELSDAQQRETARVVDRLLDRFAARQVDPARQSETGVSAPVSTS